MYKIILPPTLTILLTGVVLAGWSIFTQDTDLMTWAWVMDTLAAAVFLWLIIDYFTRGLHNLADMEKAEMAFKEFERNEKVHELYEQTSHTEDYLRGFATATEFFARNYLNAENAGPTERQWYNAMSKITQKKDDDPFSYAVYMTYCLCRGAGLTTEDYARMKEMFTSSDTWNLFQKIIYHPYLYEQHEKELEMLQDS